jgi:hypothetical protein
VTLGQPALADAIHADRSLASATTHRTRLNVRAPASVSYLRSLAAVQRVAQARIVSAIPAARFRWQFGVVLDGFAVVVPRSQLGRLASLPGITVWPNVTYHALLDRSPQLIGAPQVWGPTLSTAGEGMKIGIIDDGIDQTHPFFSPTGFSYPPGFPKGQTAYTTPKVIVARAFPPPGTKYANADKPFDPGESDHATHVAGIAAGDYQTPATIPGGSRAVVSGVAPRAYLGNYKVLTIPTHEFGLDGNAVEIAAAIEQAVKDGMDVINLSLGEPEIEPSRDIVVKAIDGAAAANVVPTIAAGNDFDTAGRGSIGSPGSAPGAITAAASTNSRGGPADEIADFSSSGPTPVSGEFKPDVTAPGANILSSVPASEGLWAVFDGTSMASPHVAGSAALLRERHPTWTVPQIKSALASTGDPVKGPGGVGEVAATREGGGRIDLPRADQPLVFTSPVDLSFGLVETGTFARTISVSDAGGGPEPWVVTVQQQVSEAGVAVTATPSVAAPGAVAVQLKVSPAAAERDLTGFVVLTRGSDRRRIPYWARVERPRLGREPHRTLAAPGDYHGDTRRGHALVSSYRYPEGSETGGAPTALNGPEQVFRLRLVRQVANVGVVVVSEASGVHVQPRLVRAGDENRLVGYTGLPGNINPYGAFGAPTPAVSAVLPTPGTYDVVFDTVRRSQAGPFTFRYWVNDVTPPRLRYSGRRGDTLDVVATDAGAGVDPSSAVALVDGRTHRTSWRDGHVLVSAGALAPGRHRLVLRVSDYQEAKNMEDVGPITPNTSVLSTTFTVR